MHSTPTAFVVLSALTLGVTSACSQDPDEESRRQHTHAPEPSVETRAPTADVDRTGTILDAEGRLAFHDVRAQTEELIGYYETIELSPDQQRVKERALRSMPAPCCSNFSALTCCCECNLSRSIWGLSHHLIVRGHDAEQVRGAVERWLAFVNPSGHSGESCFTGGCNRPFSADGCGGMQADRIVFDG